jgi:hypothetical protein
MSICKYYINGKCNQEHCRFKHVDNVCLNFYYGTCKNKNCKKSHKYKLDKPKNTETFEASFDTPDMKIVFNKPIKNSNEVCIINNLFFNPKVVELINNEVSESDYLSWHGDTHWIADDSSNWKENSPTFKAIIGTLCTYFNMTPNATRLNYYLNSEEWKPYHHDASAIKPDKAETQNITVGVSFGLTREISFQSAEVNKKTRKIINFELTNGTIYAFGNQINIDFRHGIPKIKELIEEPRVSIIIWGYSNYLK